MSEIAVIAGILASATVCLYLIFKAIVRERLRAGLCTSVVVIASLSFGHVVNATGVTPGSREEGALLVAFLLILASGLVFATQAGGKALGATRVLNLVSVVLLGLNALPAARAITVSVPSTTAADDVELGELTWQAGGSPRDIYYLVFDRYAGERTLEELYGFDNRPILSYLEHRGFTVVPDAVANYPQTAHSLASTLNMTYLDGLASRVGPEYRSWTPLLGSLQGSAVSSALQRAGYRYVMIGSWWVPTAEDPSADANYVYGRSNSFSDTFYRTTLIPYVAQWLSITEPYDHFRTQYQRVGFQVKALEQVAKDPSPTFAFAHFTLPHYPYVFDAEGNYIPPGSGRAPAAAYVAQLEYTNSVIRQIVDELLSGPPRTHPIIIIQSDEGPHPPDRDTPTTVFSWTEESDVELGRKMRILNACYFPGSDTLGVLPTRTPVNNFRALLDGYFGADLPALPDRVFVWQDRQHPYLFTEVTSRLLS